MFENALTFIQKRPWLVVLILLATTAVLFIVYENKPPLPSLSKTLEVNREPDAYVKNATYRIYRKDGALSSILTSKEALHFPQDNSGHLRKPELEIHQDSTTPWLVKANRGLLILDNDLLILDGGVKMQGQESSGKNVEISTESLRYDNHDRFISTQQPVKITSGSSILTAVGMNVYVDEKKTELLNNVEGTYIR